MGPRMMLWVSEKAEVEMSREGVSARDRHRRIGRCRKRVQTRVVKEDWKGRR